MSESTESNRTFVRDKALKYITDRVGQVVYLDDILNEYPTFKGSSIQSALYNIVERGLVPGLEIVVRSRAWRYSPVPINRESPKVEPVKAEPTKNQTREVRQLFEKIGTAKDGSLILECENGDLYRATEL